MSWLDEHLETFVRPHLGLIPNIDLRSNYLLDRWDAKMNTVLRYAWERAKARAMGRPILLPGRDVWEFEVLARMEDFPTTFRPDFSGEVVRAKAFTGDFSEYFVLDSGYAGSVPRALNASHYALVAKGPTQLPVDHKGVPRDLLPIEQTGKLLHQLFPGSRMFRPHTLGKPIETTREQPLLMKLAATLEGTPKYWQSATCGQDGKIDQCLNYPDMFTAAAILTQYIARGPHAYRPKRTS